MRCTCADVIPRLFLVIVSIFERTNVTSLLDKYSLYVSIIVWSTVVPELGLSSKYRVSKVLQVD